MNNIFYVNTNNKQLWGYILMAIPLLAFLFVIFYFSSNVPYYDDYQAILGTLLKLEKESLFSVLFAPHHEHRIFLTRLTTYLQYRVIGQVNFSHLIIIGNLFLLGIFFLFYQITKDILLVGLLAFIVLLPNSELNLWAMGSIQNVGVYFLAFLASYLLFKSDWKSFLLALMVAVLAMFTSGNGFNTFIAPIPLLIASLFVEKDKRRIVPVKLLIWLVVFGGSLYLYFSNNHKSPSPPAITAALTDHLLDTLLYFFTLTGAFFKPFLPSTILPILSLFVCLYFLFQLIRNFKIFLRYPAISSFLVFVLLSAMVVTLARYKLGVVQSMSDRYAMIPTSIIAILITFVYINYQSWIKKNYLYLGGIFLVLYAFNINKNVSACKVWKSSLITSNQTYLNGSNQDLRTHYKVRDYQVLNKAVVKKYYTPPPRKTIPFTLAQNLGDKNVQSAWGIRHDSLEYLIVDGWAYLENGDTEDQKVYFVVTKGEQSYQTLLSMQVRDDVVKAFSNEKLRYAGFKGTIAKPDFPFENSIEFLKVGIRVENKDGESGYQAAQNPIYVAEYLTAPKKINIDLTNTPTNLNNAWSVKINNALKFHIEGWAFLKNAKTYQIEQKHLLLYNQKHSIIIPIQSFQRKDVTTYFNNGSNYDYSGVNVLVYKRELGIPSGTYQVGLYIKHEDGNSGYILSDDWVDL